MSKTACKTVDPYLRIDVTPVRRPGVVELEDLPGGAAQLDAVHVLEQNKQRTVFWLYNF